MFDFGIYPPFFPFPPLCLIIRSSCLESFLKSQHLTSSSSFELCFHMMDYVIRTVPKSRLLCYSNHLVKILCLKILRLNLALFKEDKDLKLCGKLRREHKTCNILFVFKPDLRKTGSFSDLVEHFGYSDDHKETRRLRHVLFLMIRC